MGLGKTRMSIKGQVVLPAETRKKLRLKPGTEFVVDDEDGRITLFPVTDEFIRSLPGSFGDLTDALELLRKDHETEVID